LTFVQLDGGDELDEDAQPDTAELIEQPTNATRLGHVARCWSVRNCSIWGAVLGRVPVHDDAVAGGVRVSAGDVRAAGRKATEPGGLRFGKPFPGRREGRRTKRASRAGIHLPSRCETVCR
jgi:hypothetical protein